MAYHVECWVFADFTGAVSSYGYWAHIMTKALMRYTFAPDFDESRLTLFAP